MKVWEASIHLTFPTKASCMETSADSTDSRPSIQTVCAILLASCRIWGKTGSTLEAGRMRAVVCDVKVHKQNPTKTNPTKQNPTNKIPQNLHFVGTQSQDRRSSSPLRLVCPAQLLCPITNPTLVKTGRAASLIPYWGGKFCFLSFVCLSSFSAFNP